MIVKDIPISDIWEPEFVIRTSADEDKMVELVQSIKEVGLLHPLVVRPEEDHYRLIAGDRRLTAVKALGWESVPCSVLEVGPGEGSLLLVIENLQREDVNPLDEARYFQYLADTLHLTHQEIADKIGKYREYVTRRLQLLDLDVETRVEVEQGTIPPTHALELKRIDNPEWRGYYRNIVKDHGATVAQLRVWVDDYQRSPQTADVGDIGANAPGDYIPSTYKPPCCFVCGRTLDQGGLVNVWICEWEKDAMIKGFKGES